MLRLKITFQNVARRQISPPDSLAIKLAETITPDQYTPPLLTQMIATDHIVEWKEGDPFKEITIAQKGGGQETPIYTLLDHDQLAQGLAEAFSAARIRQELKTDKEGPFIDISIDLSPVAL